MKIIMAATAAAEATVSQPRSSHRLGRVPSHTSSKSPRSPSLERGWNASPGGSRSASAADALQRRAPVLASGSAWILATPVVLAGLEWDSCGALRASRVRMRVRRLRSRLRRENDRLRAMASGPRGGLESWSRQFKNFAANLVPFLENPAFTFFFQTLLLSREFVSVDPFLFAYPALCVCEQYVGTSCKLAIVRTFDFTFCLVSLLVYLPVRTETYKQCRVPTLLCAHNYSSNRKP